MLAVAGQAALSASSELCALHLSLSTDLEEIRHGQQWLHQRRGVEGSHYSHYRLKAPLCNILGVHYQCSRGMVYCIVTAQL